MCANPFKYEARGYCCGRSWGGACSTSEERTQSSSHLWLRHHRGIVVRCGAHKVNRNECLRMHQNWVERSDVCRPAAMRMCEWTGGWMSWWMRREVMESVKLGSGVPSFKFLRVVATVYASNGNITYLLRSSYRSFTTFSSISTPTFGIPGLDEWE